MGTLYVYLLGGLSLSWDERPLPLIPGTATRSLFAYLVSHRQQAHTRDLLAGTFWPDLPDSTARKRLRQALWQIRQALPPCFEDAGPPGEPPALLLAEGDTVRIEPALPLWVDVEAFVQSQSQGEDDSLAVLERCQAAVAHYRGDFMQGYYDDWILLERERLRNLFLDVLGRLVDGLKMQGHYERALTYARRLASEDPLHEQAQREVMRLCHLLGRPREALQQFERCRQALAEELDVEPSASTQALAAEIAAQAEIAKHPHLPIAPRRPPLVLLEQPDQIPLVGRRRERAELNRLLKLAQAGQGGLVLLSGETGMGKTRLAQEVARDAAWRGLGVFWGHSCELAAPPPYQPLLEVLHEVDLCPLPEVWRRELGRLLPALAPAPPLLLEAEQEKGRLLEALARAFLALGHSSPHLVILEDVHWMDPASFEALRLLLPRLPRSHLLLLATFRPEGLAEQSQAGQSLASLQATRIPQRLELEPLREAETAVLIQRVLQIGRPAPRFSQSLYRRTAGNPFFVTETLWALLEQGLLYFDERGKWRTPWDEPTADDAQVPIAANVAQSIRQRLARLEPAQWMLLGAAAVIGRRVEFDLWTVVIGEGEGSVLAAAGELVRRGLLLEMSAPPGYCFAHETIRQVVYEALSPVRRRNWHRRVAEALEGRRPLQVEALARHTRLGQCWPQAVRYARQAGERAQAIYANQQALQHLEQADRWLADGLVDWPAEEIALWRAELAERQGQVHSLVGRYQAADQTFRQAWEALEELGDWAGAARVLNQLSFLHFAQDHYDRASRYAQMALEVLPADPPLDLRAVSLTHLGLSTWGEGRYDEARAPLEQARALFEGLDSDPYGLARCLNSLGLVHLELGELDPAEDCFARALLLRREIGDRRGEAWCCHNQGRAALVRGDLAGARENLEQARSIFEEIQHPYGLQTCARFLAQVEQVKAERGDGPQQWMLELPRADRPPADEPTVTITWTLKPAGHIQGKLARRRHQLRLLLQQAQAQGARPTYDHLAEVLGVSRRTIERDMAALRREGKV
ncbi:MAG: AAA family ATPase [Chloroflexia bacterium]|nr:AAA family ATPase [Chloroflexia bacterium]